MNEPLVDQIAHAVLYEGYMLYPYRPSVKNRQRWTFGGLYPETYSQAQEPLEASAIQTECLVLGGRHTALSVSVRFLHLMARQVRAFDRPLPLRDWPNSGEPSGRDVDCLRVGDGVHYTWQEAEERKIDLGASDLAPIVAKPRRGEFAFEAGLDREPLQDAGGMIVGVIVRERRRIDVSVELSAESVGEGIFRVSVRIVNRTPFTDATSASRDDALMYAMVSTHTVLQVRDGEFVSMTDPPEHLRALTSDCRNVGAWPVLVGAEGEKGTLLSAPIILYDYPQIAPESPGDLFDSTEIDEILTLRIMTLTNEEKQAMSAVDERARAVLERTEALAREQLMGLHGTVRGLQRVLGDGIMDHWDPTAEQARLQTIRVAGVEYKVGDRVRIWPLGDADILDVALQGKTATIASIEQDYEDQVYLALTVDDDPGQDLGVQGKPGHRFFYRPEEVEPLDENEPRS